MPNVIEFDRLVSFFDADLTPLEKGVAKGIRLIDKLEARLKNFRGKINIGGGTGAGGGKSIDREMAKAQADIRRFERERITSERAVTRQVEREARQQANVRTREYKRSMNDMMADSRRRQRQEANIRPSGGGMGSIAGFSGVGGMLAGVGISAGAMGYAVLRAGAEVSDMTNILTAATGSLGAARAKFAELNAVAQASPGVMTATAVSTYALLKPMGVAENTINGLIQAFGRIKLSLPTADINAFAFNLNQLSVSFDKMDFKQAVENFPRFGEIVKKAFNLKSAQDDIEGLIGELKKLKEAGKLSKETWLEGFAQGVNKDVSLSKLGDTVNTKFEKLVERLKLSVAPMGESVATAFLEAVTAPSAGDKAASAALSGGAGIASAIAGMKAAIDDAALSLAESLNLLSPAEVENARAKNAEGMRLIAESINIDVIRGRVAQFNKSKIRLENIIADPNTDPKLKAGLQAQVNEYNKLISQLFDQMTPVEISNLRIHLSDQVVNKMVKENGDQLAAAYKKSLADAGQKLISGDSEQVKAGAIMVQKLRESITGAMDKGDIGGATKQKLIEILNTVPDIAPGVVQTGVPIGAALGSGVGTGIEGKQGDIANAASLAIPTSVPGVEGKGLGIGYQFALGIASGIQSGYGPVGGAIAGIIHWAVSSGKQAAEQQSPSKRAARELGLPFAEGIAVGMSGPKAKKAVKESLKTLYDDLIYEGGRISSTADRSRGAADRFFSAMLGDESGSFSGQLDTIEDYYNELYRIESDSYAKRLANITAQEDAIRQRKDLRPEEKRTMFRALDNERTDAGAANTTKLFDLGKDRNSALSEAGMRRIEAARRELARTFIESENAMIGIRRTAEAEAVKAHNNELKRIDEDIRGYATERSRLPVDSAEYIKWTNKITEANEERALAITQGAGEIKRAREQDKETLKQTKEAYEDFLRSVTDFSTQTTNAQMDAEDAKIQMMTQMGVSKEAVFAAEMALAFRRENFQHQQIQNEIRRAAEELRIADTKGTELVRINTIMNAQLEAEQQRHNAVLGQLTSQSSQNSILGSWQLMAAQLPGFQSQFRDFATGLPTILGDSFASGIQAMDGTWRSFLDGMKQAFFQSIQQMLAELARAQLIKGVVGLFSSLLGGLGGSKPLTVGGGGYASGGVPPMNQVSLVGENGPELFVPNVGGRILSNSDSKDALSGRGGGMNVSVYNNFYADKQTGAFNKASARQAAQDTSEYLQHVGRR